MSNPLRTAAVVIAALTALGGCATPGTAPSGGAPSVPMYRQVLSQPDKLQPVPGSTTALRWIDPTANFKQFDKIMIERIRVQLDPRSTAVDPNELKALTDAFAASLTKALQPPYTIVDKPGPGVLRVRLTLVDLVATNTAASVVVLLTPYATIPDMLSGAADGKPVGSAPYLGQTGIAAEFIDASNHRVLAEYADTQFGRKYDVNTNRGIDGALTSGVSNYLNAYQTWAYAQQAFDTWSQLFRSRMDQLTGR